MTRDIAIHRLVLRLRQLPALEVLGAFHLTINTYFTHFFFFLFTLIGVLLG